MRNQWRITRIPGLNRAVTLLAAASIVVGCGQAQEPEDEGLQSTVRTTAGHPTGAAAGGLSADQRYIVTYKSSAGKAAAANAGSVALHLENRKMVAVYLPDKAVDALKKNPHVADVEVDYRRYPLAETVPYGVPMVQADQVPSTPVGSLVKLCIIDSGISAGHDDFAGLPVDGNNNAGSGAWNEDLCGHGTHVAGTIAATTGNGIGVASVASDAVSLHIVKVFGDSTVENCAWTHSSNLVAALDECTAAGAKVVSMSLGGSFKSRAEDKAFKAANDAGVLSIAAAGNDGNTRKSYPASYDSVVSVAAIDQNKVVADFSQQNGAVEISAPGVGVLSTYPFKHVVTVGGIEYSAGAIEFAAFGTVTSTLVDGGLCDSVGSWSGAVVLCERGVVSFLDKVSNGEAGGAAAVIIYNNEPGNFAGTLGEGNSSGIPAVSLSQEDGASLVATQLGQPGTVESNLGHGYASLDGTSMATPHVAGVAALVWSQYPAATNDDIRAALTATAEDLGPAGRDNAYGYGLIQAKAAYDYLDSPQPDCSADGTCNPECAAGADPDCGTGPDCSADGTCNPECAAGADPDCSQCLPAGSSCSSGGECCSGNCKGKKTAKTCKG